VLRSRDAFMRKIDGKVIPILTDQQIRDLMGRNPPSWSRLYTGGDISYMGVPSHGLFAPVLQTEVIKFFGPGKWYQRLSAIVPPQGQLKNFLNAAKVAQYCPDGGRILLVGSRASAQSGNWVALLAKWLSGFRTAITIHCYDYHEIPRAVKYEGITVEAFAQPYEGDGASYDCVVDDAYIPVIGIQRREYVSKYQSLKCYGQEAIGERMSQLYCHYTEHRWFNFDPVRRVVPCQCMRCTAESEIEHPHGQSLERYFDLVEPSPCRAFLPELASLSEVWAAFHTMDSIEVTSPVQYRALLALGDPLITLPARRIDVAEVSGLAYRREVDSVTFRDRKVDLVGVTPGEFPYAGYSPSPATTHVSMADFVVLGDQTNYLITASTGHILCKRLLVGWVATGRTFGAFIEQVRPSTYGSRHDKKIKERKVKIKRPSGAIHQYIPISKIHDRGLQVANPQYLSEIVDERPYCRFCERYGCADHDLGPTDCAVCDAIVYCLHYDPYCCPGGVHGHTGRVGKVQGVHEAKMDGVQVIYEVNCCSGDYFDSSGEE